MSPEADGPSATLRDRARCALQSFVRRRPRRLIRGLGAVDKDGDVLSDDDDSEEAVAEDEDVVHVCRVLLREASLLYHTERVREALRRDPFEVLVDDDSDGDNESNSDRDRDVDGDGAVKSPQGPSRKKRKERNGERPDRRLRRRQRRQILEPAFRSADVLDFDQVATRDGYVRIEATVRLWASSPHKNSPQPKKKKDRRDHGGASTNSTDEAAEKRFVELRFLYERTANAADTGPSLMDPTSCVPTYVSYQIEYCGCGDTDSGVAAVVVGPRQRLLWVNVVAPFGVPSPHGSQIVSEDDDEGDIEYDNGDEAGESDVGSDGGSSGGGGGTRDADGTDLPDRKRRKRSLSAGGGDDNSSEDRGYSRTSGARAREGASVHGGGGDGVDDDDRDEIDSSSRVVKDQFAAGVDTDVLEEFLSQAGWLDTNNDDSEPAVMDDSVALYALLSFPFYEPEWDVVGFVLEAAFGPDDNESNDDEEEVVEDDSNSS